MTDSKESKGGAIPSQIRQWVITEYPVGTPTDKNVKLETVSLDLDKSFGKGDVLVKVLCMSVDPYQRQVLGPRAYGVDNPIGSVVRGAAVGTVLRSNAPAFAEGDVVRGGFAWRDYAIVPGHQLTKIPKEWKPSHALGVLGMPGATAYFGSWAGETVFVSAAAGAVGTTVGQLAKINGCRVVGSAGGAEKCKWVVAAGFDACIDYRGKSEEQLLGELKKACPDGIDVYFDNTGGAMTNAIMEVLNPFARIPVCGQIALYNDEEAKQKVLEAPMFWKLLGKRATAQGFLVTDFPRHDEAHAKLNKWIAEKKVTVTEHTVVGLENAFTALLGLFKGDNIGKAIVQISS